MSMDLLVEPRKPTLHEGIDVGQVDVICSLEVPELIVVHSDVCNPLVVLMWWGVHPTKALPQQPKLFLSIDSGQYSLEMQFIGT